MSDSTIKLHTVIRAEVQDDILRIIVMVPDPKNGRKYLRTMANRHETTCMYGVQTDIHIYDGVAIFEMLKDGRVWQISAANANDKFPQYKLLDCDIVFRNPNNEYDQWIITGGITVTKLLDLINSDPTLANLRIGIKPGKNELFIET